MRRIDHPHGDIERNSKAAGERRFYLDLLTLLGAPQRRRADIAQMEQAALRIMEAIGVQVLVIDEVCTTFSPAPTASSGSC